jgi:RNA polymerase sigma-70 factor (ECF subfamily)
VASQSDQADVARSLQGDGEAFARLIRRYQGQAAADLSRFTRDPRTLDELTQDVFVQAYYGLRTYRAEAPFGHWLRKITVRVGYRFLKEVAKRRARGEIEAGEEIPDAARAPADSPEEAAERVTALLERLPPRDRLVLTLMYLDDLSVAEIADRTGWSQIMVKVQAFRARQRLKKILKEA